MFRKLETMYIISHMYNPQGKASQTHSFSYLYPIIALKFILRLFCILETLPSSIFFFLFFFSENSDFFEELKGQIKKMQEVSELSRQSSTTSMGSLSEEV